MCVFVFQVLVPGGLGSVLVLVEEQQESLSHNLEGAEVNHMFTHTHTHTALLISFSSS